MVHDAVLITGCTKGSVGSGIAIAFQARGIHVFATARSLANVSHLAKVPNITTLVLDVTSSSSIAAAVETVRKKEDVKLKYLVNNAGAGLVMPLLDVDLEEAKKLYEVNLWGPLAMIQAFAPLIIAAKGTIVNVGSGSGSLNLPWAGIYGSSKAAFHNLSETLRLELEPFGVNVITVIAGMIVSNFFAPVEEKFALPPTSKYQHFEKALGRNARGEELSPNRMSSEEFGRLVCGDVLRGKRGNIYRGTLAWTLPLIGVLPRWYIDWYCRRTRGLQNSQKDKQA